MSDTNMTKRLWIDGGGRIFCSGLRCAGMTAHYSIEAGRPVDLNGAPLARLTPAEARAFHAATGAWPKCETCGAEASLLSAKTYATNMLDSNGRSIRVTVPED